MTHSRITIRYASGDIEHRYESNLPKVGDRLGRNGSEGFVTCVEADGPDHARVNVGTPAAEGVVWDDLNAPETRDGETARARERILDTAYELFSTRGIRAVGTEEVLAKAGVAKSTLYRHFPSKEELVLAFLQRREQRWTRGTSRRRQGGGDRRRASVYSRYSTSSMTGFTETTSKDARSSMCYSKWAIRTVRSERQVLHTWSTSARWCARWRTRPGCTTRGLRALLAHLDEGLHRRRRRG